MVENRECSAEFEREDDIDDEDYQTREVYAHFGLAVFHAQVLEHHVVNLAAVANVFPNAAAGQSEFDSIMDRGFRQVLGQLVKEISSFLTSDATITTDLAEIVKKRNFLIHHYWRERVGLSLTPRGRNRMIVELQAIQQQFQDVGLRFQRMVMRYAAIRGLTDAQVAAKLEKDIALYTALDGYVPEELPDLAQEPPEQGGET
jgi:hypothetical protein